VSIGFIKGLDQYSEVEFVSFTTSIATGPACFVSSRMAPVTFAGYSFQITNAGGTERSRLIRFASGTFTVLQDTITGAPIAGDVYRLEARLDGGGGMDLECFHNGGSVLSFNDPAPAAANLSGIPGIATRTSGAQVHNFTNLDCGAL
jgi:hypothetical protein